MLNEIIKTDNLIKKLIKKNEILEDISNIVLDNMETLIKKGRVHLV